ncbi:extracellular solute-binding protein [Paenibacillus rigui]|uniref:ABC transporter substrate-binding protein n=1 Tax=Paenibacillus rigui TaxID=554312 RepID=A0A229URL0_9BACL|nr:extracellular solute-binding protein [Paenibacillus rigui]OXM86004.1 ABC transporter substrate-binding protein [Paenibacillus rigui]
MKPLPPKKTVLTLIVLCILMTACNSEPQGSQFTSQPIKTTTKITFWTPFSGGDGSFMRELVNQYNQENTEHVFVELTNNNSDEYYTRLPTAIVTDEAPDVAIIHASRFAQYVPAGFLTNIQQATTEANVNWNDYNTMILNKTTVNGSHYAIPLDTHFDVMYYNKKWIKQAGLLREDGSLNLEPGEEGFIQFLRTLQKRIPSNIAPLALPNTRSDAYWLWWSFYNQMNDGGQFYGNEGNSLNINNGPSLRALNYVNELYTSKLIPPDLSDTFSIFQADKAALLILGVWSTGALESESSLDLGVAPIPLIYDHPAVWGDSHTMAFPAHTKSDPAKVVASIKFADWISKHGDSWARAGHIPGNLSALKSKMFTDRRFSSIYTSEVDHVTYFPDHPFQGKINDFISSEIAKMLHQSESPEDVLRNSQNQITKQIQEHFGE